MCVINLLHFIIIALKVIVNVFLYLLTFLLRAMWNYGIYILNEEYL